jgi:hypothetical protein
MTSQTYKHAPSEWWTSAYYFDFTIDNPTHACNMSFTTESYEANFESIIDMIIFESQHYI